MLHAVFHRALVGAGLVFAALEQGPVEAELVAEEGSLPPVQVAHIGAQVADGLAAADEVFRVLDAPLPQPGTAPAPTGRSR